MCMGTLMDIRKVKDVLSKAKLYATRGDFINSLKFMLQGLRDVSINAGAPPTEIRALIREVSQIYANEQRIKSNAKASLIYSPGQEKTLYATLKKVYDAIAEKAVSETYDETLERKRKLDKHLILGKRYLADGKIADADAMFQESLKLYKDEKHLFPYIAKILSEANQDARALFYLKKAAEVDPKNEDVRKMIQALLAKREEA